MVFGKHRFGIKCIDLRRTTVHEKVDDVFGFGREMGCLGCQWIGAGTLGCRGSELLLLKNASEAECAHTGSHSLEKFSAAGGSRSVWKNDRWLSSISAHCGFCDGRLGFVGLKVVLWERTLPDVNIRSLDWKCLR